MERRVSRSMMLCSRRRNLSTLPLLTTEKSSTYTRTRSRGWRNGKVQFVTVAIFIQCLTLPLLIDAQLAWTPIQVDSESQVDLWTRTSAGCPCLTKNTTTNERPLEGSDSCACCVRGGCQCGSAPTRCGQCGLESYCTNMCNITLDSRQLQNSSGVAFGQIKSPLLQGPVVCKYYLRPVAGQRVELQVYRLVSVGRFNGHRCEGGSLRFADSIENTRSAEMCGSNERYTHPAVLFSDGGATTLVFNVTETTERSQFLAHFSFTPLSHPIVGFHPKGGNRVTSTECDWSYHDYNCRTKGTCAIASPGFPGIYPPEMVCRYFISTSTTNTRVRISFTSMQMPEQSCDTHFITLFEVKRSGRGKKLHDITEGHEVVKRLATTCGVEKKDMMSTGPHLMLEFRSGKQVPPYDYNGFAVTLDFAEPITTTSTTTTTTNPLTALQTSPAFVPTQQQHRVHPQQAIPPPLYHGAIDSFPSNSKFTPCDMVITDSNGRSGHFDTRGRTFAPTCRLIFKGKPNDVVHISVFNYRLKAPSCWSVLEVVDVAVNGHRKSIHKICSPASRTVRGTNGTLSSPLSFVSAGPQIMIELRRPTTPVDSNQEYFDGAFMFHDEEQRGTLQPTSLCDTHHYGLSSPNNGSVTGLGSEHVYWNIEGVFSCAHYFIPGANQSITLRVDSLDRMASQPCETVCGDGGCQCLTRDEEPLSKVDHIMMINEREQPINCICSSYHAEWLPVSLRSWTPVKLLYNVAQYSWNKKGFVFSASYEFNADATCGQKTFTTHSGALSSHNFNTTTWNSFHYQQCTWILDSNVERQLVIEISSEQSRSCNSWNISVHEFNSADDENNHVGERLHLFCPRDKLKAFTMPWTSSTVVVRVQAMTRMAPVYNVRWHSQMVRANTRLHPTPTSNVASKAVPETKNGLNTVTTNLFGLVAHLFYAGSLRLYVCRIKINPT